MEIFKLFGSVFVDNEKANKSIDETDKKGKGLGSTFGAMASKAGKAGETLTKYVTVPLVAAGAGMTAMGKTFKDAFDKIRIGTGATGKALEGLNDDFRKVAKQVPSSFGDISTAIADYNTRLGISGQALQDLSVQTLNLARITDSDLGTVIEETSQSFQAFNIPAEKYGENLDYIFKVSQSTGIGIDQLQKNLVKFAPALKQMGFDFQESATLMGFFDKAGVEVEQAMAGLNKALVNMAKAGVTDSHEALRKLFEEIKNAPSDIKATELAIEVFGSKAGPLMASAIREGKLEYEELVQELLKSKETINGVAGETDDWAEGLAKLKNQVMIATEPIAGALFGAINGLIPLLERAIVPVTNLAEKFANMPQGVQVAILAFAGLLAALGPVLQFIGAIVIAAPGVAAAFSAISTAGGVLAGVLGAITLPIALIIAGIAALITIGVLLYKNWDELMAFAVEMWDNLKKGWTEGTKALVAAWTGMGTDIGNAWKGLWDGVTGKYQEIKGMLQNISNEIVSWMTTKFGTFKTGFLGIWEAIVGGVKGYANGIIRLVNGIIDALNTIQVDIPEWVPGYGGDSFGINLPQVPYLAKGGDITRSGWAVVGDQGPELLSLNAGAQVRPLDKTAGVVFERGAFEGAFIMDDYGVDRLMDRIFERMAAAGRVM